MVDHKGVMDSQVKEYAEIAKAFRKMYPFAVERFHLMAKVKALMDWDEEKAETWFSMTNLNFGGLSPDILILMGRGQFLERYIQEREAEKNGDE